MKKSKESFTIGTRVRHTADSSCDEGVVIWRHADYTGVVDSMKGKVWSVHWSNGKRGIYSTEDIQRIPPKNIKKIVESQLDTEDIIPDEEK